VKSYLVFFLLFLCGQLFAQPRALQAVKVDKPPRIDGKLDDASWAEIPVASDFIQNFPNFGRVSTLRTEVRIAYDDAAIYVGAYLFDEPGLIRKQITSRDGESQTDVDYFSVFFDTYSDKQNGFQFLVTSANVQTDARLGPNLGGDFNNFGDRTWDAVWESEVSIQPDGWIVEMKIPYISLRFSKNELQDWGMQLLRYARRNNESSYWSPVDPSVNGFVNQFGRFEGLKDIQPPLRLSFSPYVSTGVRNTPQKNGNLTEWLRNGGMDVKYGINESFTLDATLIPDFGQVVSDNVVNNLTPYEIRFQENRPFFTEGTELFNKSGLFYSRRVGAMPPLYYNVKFLVENDPNLEIRKNPATTQLYNAIKLSGRTKNKLGIGVFNAITAPMRATIRNKTTGEETRLQTSPLTNYNLVVLDQALKGRSYITFTNASTIRNGDWRDANASAFDFNLVNQTNTYSLRGTARYSKIYGPNGYDGYNTSLRLARISGKVQYYLQGNVESDRYDPNDLGFLHSPNEVTGQAGIGFYQYTPTKNFLSYNYNLSLFYNRMYNPGAYSYMQAVSSFFWYFKNFWDAELTLGYAHSQHDYFLLGPPTYVKRPKYMFAGIEGSSDSRKKLFWQFEILGANFFSTNPDKYYYIVDMGLRYRFSNRFSLQVSNRNESESNYIIDADTAEINGEPIIGFVDFKDVTTTINGIYNFTPRLNLTLRLRHYWSKVLYNSFANVDANGNAITRPFISGRDENVNFFNVDGFLTWDFRLGSRLILGYKNWLGEDELIMPVGKNTYIKNVGKLFRLRHANEFTVRFIYFLDYNQLRKKK